MNNKKKMSVLLCIYTVFYKLACLDTKLTKFCSYKPEDKLTSTV